MDTSDIGTSRSGRGRRGAATPVQAQAAAVVVLGPHDSLVGTLKVDGDVQIDGRLEGEVAASGEVSVRSTGTARAKIEARDIVIGGNVEGSVVAQDLVSIGETAVISGDVHASRLRVDEGASVNATIAMTVSGDAPPARRTDGRHSHESDDQSVDVTGSPTGAGGDASAYAEVNAGSDPENGDATPETSAVLSGSDSDEG
jgi:cytoskeletal protein CcmA (bactofilin family)